MANEPTGAATAEADSSGAILLPLVIALIYGVYLVWNVGGQGGFPHPYVLAGGALASIVATVAYSRSVFGPGGRSVGGMLAGFGGLIVYAFSIYVMVWLGVVQIYRTVVGDFSIWSLVAGVIWLLLGYRILYAFWQLTEIGAAKTR